MEWRTSKICDLYEIGSGISITPDKYGSGYPFLTFKDIFNSPYIKDKIETLVESSEKDRHNSSIQKGDVFLTRTSETAEELGMSTVALKDYPDATFNGFSKRLRPITEEIVPVYAAYFFRSPFFRAQASSMSSIITRASLNNTNISHFTIKYPSKIDQIKIGNMLYSYDSQIENNQKRIKLLEQMAENLYKEWFVRFRFPGYETAEFEGGVPKGWKIKRYCEEFNIVYGKGLPTDKLTEEGYPVFGGNGQIGYYSQYLYKEPQVLISCRGAASGVINISKPYSFVTSNSLVCEVKEYTDSSFEYLSFALKQANLTQYQTGSAQPQITIDNIKKLKIIIPTKELVKEFSKQISVINNSILSLSKQVEVLTTQRDLLLPRLMSGKLSI